MLHGTALTVKEVKMTFSKPCLALLVMRFVSLLSPLRKCMARQVIVLTLLALSLAGCAGSPTETNRGPDTPAFESRSACCDHASA